MFLLSSYCMKCIIFLHLSCECTPLLCLGKILSFLGSGSRVYGSGGLSDSGLGGSDTGLPGTRLFAG